MVLPELRKTLSERRLIDSGDHVLVACSGGSDSVGLLEGLFRLRNEFRFRLSVASIDHGLRTESREEVAFVGKLARERSLPFLAERLALAPGSKIQERARHARYAALHRLATGAGAQLIAVGHTLDDQAETVLARLLRGAGVAGLGAIEPHRDDGIIRPLIDCRRDQVRQWLGRHEIPWVSDPSNEDLHFERVRIRTKILPLLEAENPNVAHHLKRLADDARAHRRVFAREVDAALMRCRVENGLSRTKLLDVDPGLWEGILRRWTREICDREIAAGALHDLRRMAAQGRGQVLLGSRWSVTIVGDRMRAQVSDTAGRSHRRNDEE